VVVCYLTPWEEKSTRLEDDDARWLVVGTGRERPVCRPNSS